MMLNLTRRAILLQLALSLGITLSAATVTSAQVVYDWSSDSDKPESYPRIRSKQLVTFTITNVNNILFSYRLNITQTPMADADFANLAKLFPFGPASPTHMAQPANVSPCQRARDTAETDLRAAIKAINDHPKLPIGYANNPPYKTVPVQDSIAAWNSTAAARLAAEQSVIDVRAQCNGQLGTLKKDHSVYTVTVTAIDTKINARHTFVDTRELLPGHDISATILELYDGQSVSTKTFSFSGTDVLTLSAGALFSRIPDRSYQSRKVPNATENVLAVEGNSRATPGVVALLNYSLGALSSKLDRDDFGLALAAGPVVKFGTQSNTTSFGFFTGVSANLYHRFYLTPGLHFGQFADFPVGFQNGSTIPANFGELNPLKRWTSRFGFAITFKTKSFDGLGGDAKVTTEETAVTPSASPSPTTSPSPASDTPENPDEDDNEEPQPQPQSLSNSTPSRVGSRTSAPSRKTITQVSSFDIINSPRGDRLVISAGSAITDYTVYFGEGRLYVIIEHAKLEMLRTRSHGIFLRDPRVERRDDNLILSFAVPPSSKAKVAEGPFGLDVLISPDQD